MLTHAVAAHCLCTTCHTATQWRDAGTERASSLSVNCMLLEQLITAASAACGSCVCSLTTIASSDSHDKVDVPRQAQLGCHSWLGPCAAGLHHGRADRSDRNCGQSGMGGAGTAVVDDQGAQREQGVVWHRLRQPHIWRARRRARELRLGLPCCTSAASLGWPQPVPAEQLMTTHHDQRRDSKNRPRRSLHCAASQRFIASQGASACGQFAAPHRRLCAQLRSRGACAARGSGLP